MKFQADLRVNVDGEWKIVVKSEAQPSCAPPDPTTDDFLTALGKRQLRAFVRDQKIVIEVVKRKRQRKLVSQEPRCEGAAEGKVGEE